jgi:hypothetical protein
MGKTSIGDFEEWFALGSWNVHRQRDGDLTDTVFQIEYLFSALNDGRLTAPEILGQFATIASAIHPWSEAALWRTETNRIAVSQMTRSQSAAFT